MPILQLNITHFYFRWTYHLHLQGSTFLETLTSPSSHRIMTWKTNINIFSTVRTSHTMSLLSAVATVPTHWFFNYTITDKGRAQWNLPTFIYFSILKVIVWSPELVHQEVSVLCIILSHQNWLSVVSSLNLHCHIKNQLTKCGQHPEIWHTVTVQDMVKILEAMKSDITHSVPYSVKQKLYCSLLSKEDALVVYFILRSVIQELKSTCESDTAILLFMWNKQQAVN